MSLSGGALGSLRAPALALLRPAPRGWFTVPKAKKGSKTLEQLGTVKEVRYTALGSISEFYDYCSPEAPPSRALAPPGGAFGSSSAACTFLPGSKSARPLWRRPPWHAHAPSPPPRPFLKPWGAPWAGLGGGRGQRGSVGAWPGLVGFGEGEEVGVASERRDKAASRRPARGLGLGLGGVSVG